MALVGDDCFYFMNAGCHRGTYCMYRHQPAAKSSVESCSNWLKGSCLNKSCTLRHSVIDSRVVPRALSSNNVQCKWEATTGCLNDQCPFIHVNKPTKVPTPAIAQTSNHSVLGNPTVVHNLQQAPSLPVNPVVVNGLPPGVMPVVQVPQMVRPGHPTLGQPVPTPANSTLLQHPLQVLPPQQQQPNVSVLGVPPQQALQTFPQNEHFTEQVKLFKEILAGKQKSTVQETDKIEDEEENHTAMRRHREKERQKRKLRKHKDSIKQHKKTKANWSKGDEEILYGDYKTVRIDKKHKKGHTGNDPEAKNYEDVLRERALRDMYKRRKHDQFQAEFEDILNEKDKRKNGISEKVKKRITDKDETKSTESVQAKRKKSDSKEHSPKPEGEPFSKDDAVELGLDASPIHEFLEEVDTDSHDNERDSSHENAGEDVVTKTPSEDEPVKQKQLPEKGSLDKAESSKPVLVIPDETTDINFSVEDDDDELLQELNEVDESKLAKESNKKNRHSRTSKSHRNNEKDSTNRYSSKTRDREHMRQKEKTNKDKSRPASKSKPKSAVSSIVVSKVDRSPPVTVKSPRKEKTNIEEISSSAKRSVIKIDDNDSVDGKSGQIIKTPLLSNKQFDADNKENTTKVKLTVQKEAKTEIIQDNDIKIKTFAEIMAEKRQRKAKTNEVLLVSDDGDSPTSTCSTVNIVKPQKVKRSNSEEERVKRQSLKLYIPPVQSVVPVSGESITTTTTNELSKFTKTTTIGGRKIISLKKPKLSTEIVDETSTRMSSTIKSTLAGKKEGGVMSFEQIMEAKRLRKQKEVEAKQNITTEPNQPAQPKATTSTSSRPSQVTSTTTVTTTKKSFLKRKTIPIRPTTQNSTSLKTKNETVQLPAKKGNTSDQLTSVEKTAVTSVITTNQVNIVTTTVNSNQASTVNNIKLKEPTDVTPLNAISTIPKTFERSESLTEEQLLGEITPTSPTTPFIDSIASTNILTSNNKSITNVLSETSSSVSTAPLPNTPKMKQSSPVVFKISKEEEEEDSKQISSQTSMDDIKEALEEEKRKKEKDLLSDDEFEKEIFDLCSGDDNDDMMEDEDYGDIDEDDLMMELQEMIDS